MQEKRPHEERSAGASGFRRQSHQALVFAFTPTLHASDSRWSFRSLERVEGGTKVFWVLTAILRGLYDAPGTVQRAAAWAHRKHPLMANSFFEFHGRSTTSNCREKMRAVTFFLWKGTAWKSVGKVRQEGYRTAGGVV